MDVLEEASAQRHTKLAFFGAFPWSLYRTLHSPLFWMETWTDVKDLNASIESGWQI